MYKDDDPEALIAQFLLAAICDHLGRRDGDQDLANKAYKLAQDLQKKIPVQDDSFGKGCLNHSYEARLQHDYSLLLFSLARYMSHAEITPETNNAISSCSEGVSGKIWQAKPTDSGQPRVPAGNVMKKKGCSSTGREDDSCRGRREDYAINEDDSEQEGSCYNNNT
jgi:hypothetical protein